MPPPRRRSRSDARREPNPQLSRVAGATGKLSQGPQPLEVRELADRFKLSQAAHRRLGIFLSLLCGDPRAPTALRSPARVLDDHLADSLVALELPGIRDTEAIADLGSGAGIPGVVLAIALPDADVALVESAGRKCAFLGAAAQACSLTNVQVVCRRAEEWPEGRDRFDLVTARALAPLPVVVEYAAPLLRIGGLLLAWRGRRDHEEERAAAQAALQLGLRGDDPVAVAPYPAARHRHLQRFVKLAATPSGFPRRPGMARKRPLGAARDHQTLSESPAASRRRPEPAAWLPLEAGRAHPSRASPPLGPTREADPAPGACRSRSSV